MKDGRRHSVRAGKWLAAFAALGAALALTLALAGQRTAAGNQEKTIEAGGRMRRYVLHVPPQYDGKKPLPLVIVLHGGGGNAASAERMSGFSAKADREEFLVAYPNGNGRLRDRLLTWNSGNCCGYARSENVDDVGFLRAMIAQIEKEMRVDGRRIYATGMSNGGMMSYKLGCELADKLAAIGPVAGALNVETCVPSQPVSVVAVHGMDDQHVLFEGGKPKVQADRAPRVDKSVAHAMEFWRKANGCTAAVKKETRGIVREEIYSGCRNGTEVKLYAIEGEGHTWPGGQAGRAQADQPTRAFSATDAVWEFFAAHAKK
jgi:polyhydroxybutyrate depolymerase